MSATKTQLQDTIEKLEKGLASPAMGEQFKPKLREQIEKAKAELSELEAAEKEAAKPAPAPEKKDAKQEVKKEEKEAKETAKKASAILDKIKKQNKKVAPVAEPKKEEKVKNVKAILAKAKAVKKVEPAKKSAPSKADSKVAAAKKLAIKMRKKQGLSTKKDSIERDSQRAALPAGKRISADGNTYYEYRENRTDRNPKKYPRLEEGGSVTGMKLYNTMQNVGNAKYVINYHDGVKTHKDGSKFFDIKICKTKKECDDFVAKLESEGYVYKYEEGGKVEYAIGGKISDRTKKAIETARAKRREQGITYKKANILNDADKQALPAGKRISENGNVYWENRENRSDRKPNGRFPKLEDGGELKEMDGLNNISLYEKSTNGFNLENILVTDEQLDILENQIQNMGGFKRFSIDVNDIQSGVPDVTRLYTFLNNVLGEDGTYAQSLLAEVEPNSYFEDGGNLYFAHNGDLRNDWEKHQSADEMIISKGYDEDANPDYPYILEINDSSYFYASERERDEDFDIAERVRDMDLISARNKYAYGGMLEHGLHAGDTIVETYKNYGILENVGKMYVYDPNVGERHLVADINVAKSLIDEMDAKEKMLNLQSIASKDTITKKEYEQLLRDYNRLTGLYEDETDDAVLADLTQQIDQLESKINQFERSNGYEKGGSLKSKDWMIIDDNDSVEYAKDFNFFIKNQIGVSKSKENGYSFYSKLEKRLFKMHESNEELSQEQIVKICKQIHNALMKGAYGKVKFIYAKGGKLSNKGAYQNAPASGKAYTRYEDSKESNRAKPAGWRYTDAGAKRLRVSNPNTYVSKDHLKKYKGLYFTDSKGNKHRYIYIERRADKSDIKRGFPYLEKGGSIKQRRFTINDFRRLTNDGFEATYTNEGWAIKEENTNTTLGIFNEDKETIKAVGSKKLDNPLVKWLQQNSHVSSDEYYILEKGGGIPNNYAGKTAEHVWNEWSREQKIHFLQDHEPNKLDYILEFYPNLNYNDFKTLEGEDGYIIKVLKEHISEGQYQQGGYLYADDMGIEDHQATRVYVKPNKLEGKAYFKQGDGVYVKFEDGSDGFFSENDIIKLEDKPIESEIPENDLMGHEINVFGYQTKNFDLHEQAIELFKAEIDKLESSELREIIKSERKSGLADCARTLDSILGTAKEVYESPNPVTESLFTAVLTELELMSAYWYKSGASPELLKLPLPYIWDIAGKINVYEEEEVTIDFDKNIDGYEQGGELENLFSTDDYLTLDEYKNQEDPKYGVKVLLTDDDYAISYSAEHGQTTLTHLFINGFPYEYVKKSNNPRLYSTDSDGNLRSLTVFYIDKDLTDDGSKKKIIFEDGGELKNLRLTSKEKIILNAVYLNRIDGLKGQISYYQSGDTRWFDEQVRGNKQQEIANLETKIESVKDDIKFLSEQGYPYDLTNAYDAKIFLKDLNDLVRTKNGRELFSDDNPNGNEMYEAYEKVYFKIEKIAEEKFGDAVY